MYGKVVLCEELAFFVYLSINVIRRALRRKNCRDQKGKCLNNFPFRALPITPKLMIKLVPLPLS
jgi:hypothetical protein